MRRALFSAISVFVATAALTLSPSFAFAQQDHDHGTPSSGEKSCACCRMSGSGAMAQSAATQAQPPASSGAVEEGKTPADAVDHAALGHVPPPQSALDPKAQEQAAGHSCGMMAAKEGTDAGGCACCAGMAKMSAHADGKAAGGCAMCASKMAAKDPAGAGGSPDASTSAMPGGSSCGNPVTASTAADPLAEDSAVTEQ